MARTPRSRLLLSSLALAALCAWPAVAGDGPKPADKETAKPAEPCGACTGSLVKAWRIRNGDPKHPAATKSLKENEKKSKGSNLAD